jgi:putative sigma-54 modulation protein
MQLSVTGRHIDVTEALKSYVTEKIGKLQRHFEHVIDVHIILSVEKLTQKAEATVQLNGATLFAEDEQEDMYAAIDGLLDKLDRQILKHKDKLSGHH